MKRIRVVQMGLGPIGNKLTQFLIERRYLEIVGAIDLDPAKLGKDVGSLAGLGPLGVAVQSDAAAVLRKADADVVLLTTTSSLRGIRDQIVELLPFGVNIVSSCEELSYPWIADPALAAHLDELARWHKVAVLATGVNPGFLMDHLPITLTGLCREVRKITVERIQDATFRRIPFQKKIGAGLSLAEFAAKVRDGSLRHVGLPESMQMIAAALGWKLDGATEAIAPIVAERRVATQAMTVEAGYALGVQQIGCGMMGGREVIAMIFRAAIGEPDPRDRIVIDGTPVIDSCIKGGVNGDVATCAALVNAIPSVIGAKPGLRTMPEVEPPRCLSGVAE